MTDSTLVLENGTRIVVPTSMVFDAENILKRQEYYVPVSFETPPTVLDLGANSGVFAIWAGLTWPGCRIHCFEPHPAAYAYLERNAQPHMTLHPLAVVGPLGGLMGSPAPLKTGRDNLGCSSFYELDEVPGNTTEEAVMVETIRAKSLPHADVVKLDVEGGEHDILTELDLSSTSVVMLEYHYREHRKSIEELLVGKGFTLWSALIRAPHLGTLRFVREDRGEKGSP